MKRGFTLVELLATIVILAIVSLITIPIITGVINKTRLNSLKSSAYGLLEASNLYMAQYELENNIRFNIDNNKVLSNDTTDLIKYKGSIKEGTVILNKNGKVTLCITDGVNSAYKNYNDTKVTLVKNNKCYIPDNTSIVYLEKSGVTINELSNQELTTEVELLKKQIASLNEKIDTKSDLTLNDIYPVGSIYMSMTENTKDKVEAKFGGKWEKLESKFLYGATSESGLTGGSNSVSYKPSGTVNPHTLTISEMPSHHHAQATNNGVAGATREVPAGIPYGIDYGDGQGEVPTANTGGSQPHQHSFTGTPSTINTMPSYITVYMYKRVA